MIAGKPYSFSGLEKKAVAGFEDGTKKRKKVDNFMKILKDRGIEIEMEVDVENGIGFEMTGKPFQYGNVKVKNDFIKVAAKYGYVHKSLKEAKILLTDSMSSTSSKMTAARKAGVKIMTYEDFLKNNGEI